MIFETQTESSVQFVNAKTNKTPWLQFVYLAVCFFLAMHDPMASTWDANRSAETFAATAGSGSLTRQISFLMLALYGMMHLRAWRSQRLQRQRASSIVTLLLGAWMCLSYLWSQSPGASLARLSGILALLLVGAAVCLRFQPRQIVKWVGLTTLCFVAIGILCELALGTFHPLAADYRFAGTLHPNEQGVNCALAAIAAWHLSRSSRHNRFWTGAFLTAIVFTFLTKSRTAFFAVLAALALSHIFLIKDLRKRCLIWSVAGVLVTAVLFLQFTGIVRFQSEIQLGRDAGSSDTESLTGRLPLWSELLKMSAEHRMLGYGYGGFWTPGRIEDTSNDQGWGVSASHSAYLDMLLALGPVGICLYTTSLLIGIRRARVRYSETADLGLAFLGMVQVFCLIDGIADSAPVEVSSFLCFCWIMSLFYIGFVVPGGRKSAVRSRHLDTEIAIGAGEMMFAGRSGAVSKVFPSKDLR